ncbi:MAG: SRPBCC family protein [Micrococcales bacterium]|nr:SRPBCC family protein [Micrococcales bacterium]
MELTHSFTVPAPIEQAWATFMDLEQVGSCFPGATVTEVDGDSFKGTVKVKLGPIALMYAGSGTFVEKDESAHRAVIEAKGKDKRGNGTAGATASIQLTEEGPGQTRADVRTELHVTGKPAQFGRGVMQDVSDKLLGQFIDCVEGKLGHSGDAPEVASGPAAETTVADGPGAAASAGEAAGGGIGGAGGGTDEGVAAAASAEGSAAGVTGSEVPGDSERSEATNSSDTPVAQPISPGSAGPAVAAGHPHLASAPAASRRPAAVSRPAASDDDDAIDLGSTVGPVLLKTYGIQAGAALGSLLLGILIGKRLGRSRLDAIEDRLRDLGG